MKTVKLRSRVGPDGMLDLHVSTDLPEHDVEVVVIVSPVAPAGHELNSLGWSKGFFEEVIGSWQGEPLVREPEGEYEKRRNLH